MSHVRRTDAGYDVEASKRRINITVNEDLVRIAQAYTNNLSGTIEELLAAWMQEERRKQDAEREHRDKVMAAWNDFYQKHGRFSEEWSRDFLPEDDDR